MLLLYKSDELCFLSEKLVKESESDEKIEIEIVGELSIQDTINLLALSKQIARIVSLKFKTKMARNLFDANRRTNVLKEIQRIFSKRDQSGISKKELFLFSRDFDEISKKIKQSSNMNVVLKIEKPISLDEGIRLVDLVSKNANIVSCFYETTESPNDFVSYVFLRVRDEIQKVINSRFLDNIAKLN